MANAEANPQRCRYWNMSSPHGRCNKVDPSTDINVRSIPTGVDDLVLTFEGVPGNLFSCKFECKDIDGQRTCNGYAPTGK